jgi:predicted Rossmann fold flavoprotein
VPTLWDAVVVGAGAAGLFCAGVAGQRGKKILVLDHAKTIGEKIRISGGGRCNFTNRLSSPAHFLSFNPHFCKSALARYTPQHFIDLIRRHRIAFHEKHKGQLFCDDSSQQVIDLLKAECHRGGVQIRHPVSVREIRKTTDGFLIMTSAGQETTRAVVMATGGLPVPAIGATDYALTIAQQFGLNLVSPRPALVPLSFTSEAFTHLSDLSGLSLPVRIRAGTKGQRYGECLFEEDLLVTHKGLSGPAILQVSSYWSEAETVTVDWLDGVDCQQLFDDPSHRLKLTESVLAMALPQRLAKAFAEQSGLSGRKWAEVGKKDRAALALRLTGWTVKPAGTLGWKKAEVMLGGVDTQDLESQTMMSKRHSGLYFIGECVDVTGHLGGHNFQWAWASGFACGNAL